jgi:hypothetical protein
VYDPIPEQDLGLILVDPKDVLLGEVPVNWIQDESPPKRRTGAVTGRAGRVNREGSRVDEPLEGRA